MAEDRVAEGWTAEGRIAAVWTAEIWTVDGVRQLAVLPGEQGRAHASADEARHACACYRDEALYWTAEDGGGWWAAGDEASYRVAALSPLVHLLTTPL